MRHRDLPTGRARPQSLERNHVPVVAVRTAPNLQTQIREHDGLLVGDAEHVKVLDRGQRAVVIDRVRHHGIVVTGQQHDGQRRSRNDGGRSIEHIDRHAMAIEGVAGQHHHVGASRASRAQDAGEPAVPSPPCKRAV